MYKITFVEATGDSKTIKASEGQSLMEIATENGVTGILGECGGACVCGTCQCYLDEACLQAVGAPGEDEAMLLEFSEHVKPGSRLGCQIKMNQALDGAVVQLPPSQP